MTKRYDDQVQRIMSHPHVGRVNIFFERENAWDGKVEVVAHVSVYCTHHHAPFSQRAHCIEMALARVENWLDSQDSCNWSGAHCGGENFKRSKYDALKSRGEEYSK